jgi:glyoxylase-like metal-dependent hydrolase (beta-lactamase superfamily II)
LKECNVLGEIAVLEIKFDYAGASNIIYPVILRDEQELILIDCGYPGFLSAIRAAAKEKGIDISRLTKIIVTHHDFDHMGALAEFKKEYPQIEILASIKDEKYISGKEKSLRLQLCFHLEVKLCLFTILKRVLIFMLFY